jgi:hypothetical protein
MTALATTRLSSKGRGSRDDVYELAQKIVRLGLAPSATPRKEHKKRGAGRKKK